MTTVIITRHGQSKESIRHFFAGRLSSHSRDKGFRKQLWSLNTLRRHGVAPQCARVR
jgi:hypothetical protein